MEERRRRTRILGALLALAGFAVLGSLAIYKWAEAAAEARQRFSELNTSSPETQAPQPASPTTETAKPSSASERARELRVEEPGSGEPGPLSAVQKRAMAQGYLVPDQAAYEKAKAEANAKAEKQFSSESPSSIDTAAP